jgi:hypothetical protein
VVGANVGAYVGFIVVGEYVGDTVGEYVGDTVGASSTWTAVRPSDDPLPPLLLAAPPPPPATTAAATASARKKVTSVRMVVRRVQ